MTESTVRFRATLVILCNALILAVSSPVYMPQFLPGGTGRNIRHLPCVSRKSGETGVCMFAYTCAKANGTHLGTCIDRFYFGSCCKIDVEPDIYPHDNTIDDGPVKPYPTNHDTITGNNIPEYSPRPISNPTKPTSPRVTEAPLKTTQITTTTTTTTRPIKYTEKPTSVTTQSSVTKPVRVNLNSTNKYTTRPVPDSTTESVGLSTFQTVQSNPPKTSPSPRPTSSTTTKPPQKTSTTVTATSNPKPKPSVTKPTTSNLRPTPRPASQNVTKVGTKPTPKPSVNKPTSVRPPVSAQTSQDDGATTNKIKNTTVKPIATTISRPSINVTRFPPRNATTTTTTTTTTVRPTRPTRPRPKPTAAITKPPTTAPVKKVTTTSTTSSTPVNSRPISTLESVTVATRPSTVVGIRNATYQTVSSLPTKVTTVSSISQGGNRPGTRPSTNGIKPTTESSTVGIKQTTQQPLRPSSKPSSTSSRPSVAGGSSRPTATTHQPPVTRPKPISTQVYEPLTTVASVEKPTRVTTIGTVADTPVTRRPSPSTSQATTTSQTSSTSASPTTSSISNEVIPSDDTTSRVPPIDTSKVEFTTYSPGLVTWTSNSDDATTRSPVVGTSTNAPEEPVNTEWTPITTPDGWILIQSPSPNEPDETQSIKPTIKPTTQAPFSDTPITLTSSSTTERSTVRPSVPTVATTSSTTDNHIPTAELNMSDYKQVCGRRLFPESRIVGGARSSFGKWPWQISLRQWRTSTYLHKCGAALLNENWAITAAHCVENVPPSDLLLRLGEHDLASEEEPYGFQERRVQIVASHPQFDPRTFEYDLALLRFYEPLLPFQPNTLPICLPDDDANYVGLTAHVTGWGRLYEDGPLPSVLQEVPVPVINNTVCEAMYRSAGYIEHIPKIFICAGWRKGGYDSCEGDSGGPLVIQRPRDKRWILAGVISWGIGCAEPNQPGVYTRISEFREWINQILQF